MTRLDQTLALLEQLRHPSAIALDPRGGALVTALRAPVKEQGEDFEEHLWRVGFDGATERLTQDGAAQSQPAFSPAGDRLAFLSDVDGRTALFVRHDDGSVRAVPSGDGSIDAYRWSADGRSFFAIALDEGLDAGPTSGAARLHWGPAPDPDVFRPSGAHRRLIHIDADKGIVTRLGPDTVSFWEFDLAETDRIVALVSEDSTERGWYKARIVVIDIAGGETRDLYASASQKQSLAASPDGRHLAFIEGWSSDRGLLAADIHLIDLDSGTGPVFTGNGLPDISFLQWRDDNHIWFAGWQETGSAYGLIGRDGALAWLERDDAIVGTSPYSAHIAPVPGSEEILAVREAPGVVPEIVRRKDRSSPWQALTHFNDAVSEEFAASGIYPEFRAVEWQGRDGMPIRGLLLLPRDRRPEPGALVVSVHGGPTWSQKQGFEPGGTLPYVAAGYAVLLPNYRGSVGRGQAFTRLNVGDPAGGEFDDIVAGAEWCIAQGIAAAGRIGITGPSYGGYLTAWAVTASPVFAAGVMFSGISDLISLQNSCNNGFSNLIVDAPLHDRAARSRLFIERSPVLNVSPESAPTLIIHGELDHCCPLGQAEEFYRGLVDQGVECELAVYPREGHGFKERGHYRDVHRRAVAWFDRHLGAAGPAR